MKKTLKTIKILLIVASLVAIGYGIYINKPVEQVEPVVQGAVKDPRLEEYMNSENFKIKQELQAKLDLLEADRLAEIAKNEENIQNEVQRHANAMLKINAGLDGVRKEQLDFASSTKGH